MREKSRLTSTAIKTAWLYGTICKTRLVRDINRGLIDRDTVQRCLDDGVLFCVQGTDAMATEHETARLVAMRQSRRASVVACRQDALVAHQDRAYRGAVAGAAPSYLKSKSHEVAVPCWTAALIFDFDH